MKKLWILAGILYPALLAAQDLEKLKTADPLHANGSMGWNQIWYQSNRMQPSRLPQTWVFSGNLNLRLFDIIQAPFSFQYSNQGNQFTQPTYNQTNFHPTWRWMTLHVGTLSQNWGAYTVNGHVFRGAAAELRPGKWNFVLLRGIFQKAIQPDSLSGIHATPVFKRSGTGLNAGWQNTRTGLQMQFFQAVDIPTSIHVTDFSDLTPQKNQCAGLQWRQMAGRNLQFHTDFAVSEITPDMRHPEAGKSLYTALKLGAEWHLKSLQLRSGYEKIDPGYRTFGAYYFNNDLENITAGIVWQEKKGRLQFQVQGGKQHDNLKQNKLSQMNRSILGATLNLKGGKKWNANFSYNNFLSYTNLRPYTDYQQINSPYLAWDTLNFRQISENIQAGFQAKIISDTIKTVSLNASLTRQRSTETQGEKLQPGQLFYNASAGISYAHLHSQTVIALSGNAGQYSLNGKVVQNFSPVISCNKSFFHKILQARASFCQTITRSGNATTGNITNLRGGLQFTAAKIHRFSLQYQYLIRHDLPVNNPYVQKQSLREWTLMLNYQVSGELFKIKGI